MSENNSGAGINEQNRDNKRQRFDPAKQEGGRPRPATRITEEEITVPDRAETIIRSVTTLRSRLKERFRTRTRAVIPTDRITTATRTTSSSVNRIREERRSSPTPRISSRRISVPQESSVMKSQRTSRRLRPSMISEAITPE